MSNKSDNLFISLDADNAGNRISQAVLADDPDEMSRISERINLGNKLVERWAKERNGRCLSSGGDQGVYSIKKEYTKELEQLRKDYHFITGLTVSVGVGEHLSESGQALLVAKLLGKNRIVYFDKATKKKIQQIKKAAKKGRYKTMEEQKIAEANFKKSETDDAACPYCEQTDGIDPDHCKFCHDAETIQGEEDCPYCKGSQNEPSLGPKEPEIAEEDCAFCKDKDASAQDACPYCNEGTEDPYNQTPNADKEEEQAEAMDMGPPEIGKPEDPDKRAPIGQNAPMDVIPKNDIAQLDEQEEQDPNQKLTDQRDVPQGLPETVADPEDNSSREALSNIAEQIENDSNPLAGQADNTDEIGNGTDMEGNISRPEGFNQTTPSDMGEEGPNGLSDQKEIAEQDEPDFADLLGEGLDQHADEIQKERAIQMVSQALVQFKGCKDILEQNKMQMPQLYQASISMLKAMIEMAGVLKLGQNGAVSGQSQELGQEQAALEPEQEENEWHEPFPTHPDHGGEQKTSPPQAPTDASPAQTNADGTGQKPVGQAIGKLPSKATTEHVARTPLPVGAVNAKGQKKVMDDQGKVRFINMKQGMVQGASGVPVKPAQRK